MRRDSFDKAGEEIAEDIVEEIPATPAEIAANLPDDMETLVEEAPELPDETGAFTDNLPEELANRVENSNEIMDCVFVFLPDKISEELD